MNDFQTEHDCAQTSVSLKAPARVVTVHDISCIGRCASTVILPVLSVCGVQACPLPTALLSTHTGGYSDFTFLDLTDEMKRITAHWARMDTAFDAVYSGFLGSVDQIEIVRTFASECKKRYPDCLFLADPVMGDDGKPYTTYTEAMCRKTRELVADADVITPNLTEACILLERPFRTDFTEHELESMAEELSELTTGTVFMTGIHRANTVGVLYYDRTTHTHGSYFTPRDPNNYPGAGDIFASVVLAGLMKKLSPLACVQTACDFIYRASVYTTALHTPVREGLAIEPLLADLAVHSPLLR